MSAVAVNRMEQSNGNGKAHAKAEKPPLAERISIPKLMIREFKLMIKGTSPLIVHKFSEKQKKQIEDKQQKKAKAAREKRDPHAEFLAAMYLMPNSGAPLTKKAKYGVPAAGFKKAAVSACRYIDGIDMTFARGAFFVMDDGGGLVQIECSDPVMREDTVRLSGPGRALDLRYRPEFTDWGAHLRIRYNPSVLSAEQIVNLFHHAGFHIGWGEMRPEKGFSNGMFEVVTAE